MDNPIIHPSTLDVFQYLTDVEVNTTITDDLVNEVCHTAQSYLHFGCIMLLALFLYN